MISFEGDLSPECKNFMLKRERRINSMIAWVVAILFSIPVILTMIFLHPSCALFLPCILLFALFSYLPIGSIKGDSIYPNEIVIEEDCLESKGKKFDIIESLEYVKAVVDYGDWYDIIFYFPHKSLRFVCEKCLLKQGSISEFENLFADKLIRN